MSLNTLSKLAAAVVVTGLLATEAGAADPKSEADKIAETFLKAGSKLFDAKDAAGLAATYTEDGQILLVTKKDGQIQNEVREGRANIEELYRERLPGGRRARLGEHHRALPPDLPRGPGRSRPLPREAGAWPSSPSSRCG